MEVFIIVLIVIVSLLIGLVVLVQNPKGGGLAEGFQGAANVGGVKRTTDFLEKATWVLTIALFVLCIFSASLYDSEGNNSDIEINTGDVPAEVIGGEDGEEE